ncbi:MAG: GNAT family N-acetyltransferase [Gammaproteobacteria bacterium]
MSAAPELRQVDSADAVRKLYPLMAQLRPHLRSADELAERWARQADAGYRLVALFDLDTPVALASYRVQENLVHGRFLYVEDLVTDAALRGGGHGAALMAWLQAQARALDCAKLVLDTPLDNALGHRFYFRCGLLATSLRFNQPVAR